MRISAGVALDDDGVGVGFRLRLGTLRRDRDIDGSEDDDVCLPSLALQGSLEAPDSEMSGSGTGSLDDPGLLPP